MRRAAAVDKNQASIVAALRAAGAVVLIVSQLKNCFDILVFYKGSTYPVELKNGAKPPSQRKLTAGEAEFKAKIEKVGCIYYIITSVDEALKMIGL